MKTIIVAVVELLAGAGAGLGVPMLIDKPLPQAAQNRNTQTQEDSQAALSSQILSSLREKKGNDFDKAFLTEMMSHNQTAIEMASLADERTEREEVKKWAKYISDAQISDIDQMKTWYLDWGFLKQDQENNPHEEH